MVSLFFFYVVSNKKRSAHCPRAERFFYFFPFFGFFLPPQPMNTS